jgi:hypothetical protein
MRVCLFLDSSRVFRWHLWLVEALTALPGYSVSVIFSQNQRPLPPTCGLVLELERLIYRIKENNALDPIEIHHLMRQTRDDIGPFDVVVDFASDQSLLPVSGRVLTPIFNDIPGEIGALFGLTINVSLSIEIANDPQYIAWIANVANDDILGRAVNNALSCAVGLLIKTITTTDRIVIPPRRYAMNTPKTKPMSVTRAAIVFSIKVGRYLNQLIKGGKTWSVGWRISANSLLDTKTASFTLLPDDGKRFYADPFPIRHDGHDFVFVEEYPFATGRGVISVAEIVDGQMRPPQPVLEEQFHLSYPFIFELGGIMWMIPETGDQNKVYLYRAEQFPYKWTRERCLLDLKGYDSTILDHQGHLWLFTCEKMWNSSTTNILSLFHSNNLQASWQPHIGNPILIDSSLSRSAGAIFSHNGQIIRPVQDCSHGYGGMVILCRIDTLNETEFGQTQVGRIEADGRGCHTYNNHEGLEVIDVFGRQRGVKEIIARSSFA